MNAFFCFALLSIFNMLLIAFAAYTTEYAHIFI